MSAEAERDIPARHCLRLRGVPGQDQGKSANEGSFLRKRARAHLRLHRGHVELGSRVHCLPRPQRAAPAVLSLTGAAQRCHPRGHCSKVQASRCRRVVRGPEGAHRPVVRPGASARLQFRPLRHEADPKVLCHAFCVRERSFGCGEGGAHHVYQDAPVQLPGHNELHGPGHHLRQMGEDIRRKADQVLAPLLVVRQPGQTGLSRSSALLALVLQTKERLRAIPRGVRGLQERVSRARHADFWRLAGVLQQSGRVSLSRGLGEDAGLLHGLGSRHLQRRGLPSRSVDAVHLAGHFEGA